MTGTDDEPGRTDAGTPEPQPEPRPEPQQPVGWLPGTAEELFGDGASAQEAYELLTVDVPAASWISALETCRTTLGCTYFDWLSAVDEPGTGFLVCAHVAALPGAESGRDTLRRLIVRTTVPHDAAVLPTATGVYAGAGWHERETHEMFGVDFTGHGNLEPLLLPENFEGHPLRKSFVLAARVAKAWPGAKEPGESGHGGPKRRQMLPPGVPDPNEWGPQKGQLPPIPSRPARGRGGDRPARRTRTAAGATDETKGNATDTAAAPEPAARPVRRNRSAGEGSASQQAPEPTAPEGTGEQPRAAARPADAPWHRARPAFEEPAAEPAAETRPEPRTEPETENETGKPQQKPQSGEETGGDA